LPAWTAGKRAPADPTSNPFTATTVASFNIADALDALSELCAMATRAVAAGKEWFTKAPKFHQSGSDLAFHTLYHSHRAVMS